jgi:predicted alpha/beta hydrolase family esterase
MKWAEMMSAVVLVPGLHNSGPQHWQSLWQRRLPGAVRVEQAQWSVPDLERWSASVDRVLDTVDDCWIVAHSFGCLATMYALAKRFEAGAQGNVRGVFLVAPADPDKFGIADRLPGRLPIAGRLVASLSDPWLAWTRAERWAERWGLPAICAGDAGHINVDSGHGSWWEGWSWFQQLRAQSPMLDHGRRPLPQRGFALAI